MSKNLIIVESPAKAKTINKYLGKDYIVEATIGHITNLPKTQLGIDIENCFIPKFNVIRGKAEVLKKIKQLSKKSNQIFIATDPDREGEAIAQDIADAINNKSEKKIFRVLFTEITKKAVNEAIKNPLEIDQHLVTSQRARRVMDRIIGYKISPFLWNTVFEPNSSVLSAGRVQSVALRMICERENEIEKFIVTEYWSIIGDFGTQSNDELTAKLVEINGKSIRIQPKPIMTEEDWNEFNRNYIAIPNEDSANDILNRIKSKNNFLITDISKKEMSKNPAPPFITSTLQSEASRRLRYNSKRTMQIAQGLYEGIELGKEGITGLITYMRTDSTRVNADIIEEARGFIKSNFGNEYVPRTPRVFTAKGKQNVQDAHEAIRPTSLKYTPEFVAPFLNDDQLKLYELIWKRFVASQMESARLEITTVTIEADEFKFKTNGTVIVFNGFMSIYEEETEQVKDDEDESSIPKGLSKEQLLKLLNVFKNQHFTKPPARFSESTLIKELESNGIGRPSTYALIVSTLLERKYVEQIERRFNPTDLGKKVNNILVKSFPEILNINFTAQMEEELDLIANGVTEYIKVLNDFYIPFSKALDHVNATTEKIKCEKCGADMELKIGRFGRFLACTAYPKCKNIISLKDLVEKTEPEYTGETCPKCGNRLVYRSGRYGKFIGCEKYPECDYVEKIKDEIGIKCPKCGEGQVVRRRSKRGKFFYGCSRYPDCDFVSWTKPEDDSTKKENKTE
ncbi:MAG: type I DNA topoisomerase [Ignavibacteriales bacterium]|nr:type I DNA topoisomerase [Ignavibacteriales bacterium]